MSLYTDIIAQGRHYDAILFNESSIEMLRTFASWKSAIANFLLGVALLSLPLTWEEVPLTPMYFGRYLLLYSVIILVLFLCSRAFSSEMPLVKFWHTISTIVLFSAVPLTILTYLCLFIFEYAFDNNTISRMILSIAPYYLFLLMAFASEQAARISDLKKSIGFGALSVIVIYSVMYLL